MSRYYSIICFILLGVSLVFPGTLKKKDAPPRKVIIGTVCLPLWEKYPGLEKRCANLGALVDSLAARSQGKYKRGLDLAILSEFALTDMSLPVTKSALALDSPGFKYFKDKAKKHKTYLVVPAVIREGNKILNAAVLLGRDGRTIGQYAKTHPVPDKPPAETFEGGTTPGNTYPVFNLDFGNVGIQICFDYRFEEGWRELARQGAELIVHTTMSPSVSIDGARAVNNHVYVVTSTWRDNASVIEPTGMVAAQIQQPQKLLVHEIDLEYRLLPWPSTGEKLKKQYQDQIGFHYYPSEDLGIFWSNDAAVPIDSMVRWQGVWTDDEYVADARKRYREYKKKTK